jgi:triacylglycerol lipase
MPYDRNRAIQLGQLIDAAYAQFANSANPAFNWQPAGYQILQTLVRENPAPATDFGYIAIQGTTLYVVIRGTQKPLEWLDDASILPQTFRPNWGNSTLGFLAIYNQLSPQILQVVQQQKALNTYSEIVVTGHSLGAALAVLAAADIFINTQDKPLTYTFCGPRTGDATFVTAFAASSIECWRIFNTEDIVPDLPLATLDLNNAVANGLQDSGVELAVKMLLHTAQLAFSHVQLPVAVTFNLNTIADNHNLSNVYSRL